jgi:hypothetical protein
MNILQFTGWKTLAQANGPLAALLLRVAQGNERIAMHAALEAAKHAKTLPKITPKHQAELAIGLAGAASMKNRLERIQALTQAGEGQAKELAAAVASLQQTLPHCTRAQHVLLGQKHDMPVDRVGAVAQMLAGRGYELDDVLAHSKRPVSAWFSLGGGFNIVNFARSAKVAPAVKNDHHEADWLYLGFCFTELVSQIEQTLNPVFFEVENYYGGNLIGLDRTLFLTERRLLLTQPAPATSLSQIREQLWQSRLNGGSPRVAEIQVRLQDGRLLHLAADLDADQQLRLVEKLRTERDAPHHGGYPLLRSTSGALLYSSVVSAQHSDAPLIHHGSLQTLEAPQLVPLEGLISTIQYQLFPANSTDQRGQQVSSYQALVQAVSTYALPTLRARVWAVDEWGAPVGFELRSRNGQLLSFPPLSPARQAKLRQLHYLIEDAGNSVVEVPARMPLNLQATTVTLASIVAKYQGYYEQSERLQAGQSMRLNVVARTANNQPHQHFQLQFHAVPRPQGPGYVATPAVEVLDAQGHRLEDTGAGIRLPVSWRSDGVNLNTQHYSQLTVETYSVDARGAPDAALYRKLDVAEMGTASPQNALVAALDTQPIQQGLKSALAHMPLDGNDHPDGPWRWFIPQVFTAQELSNGFGRDPLSNLFFLKSEGGLRGLKERLLDFYQRWKKAAGPEASPTAWVAHVGLRPWGATEDLLFQVRVSQVINERGQLTEHVEFLDTLGRLLDVDHAGQPCVWSAQIGKPVSLDVQFDLSESAAYLSKQAFPIRNLAEVEVHQRIPGWQKGLNVDAGWSEWPYNLLPGMVIRLRENTSIQHAIDRLTLVEKNLRHFETPFSNILMTVTAVNDAGIIFDFRVRLVPTGKTAQGASKFKIEYLGMDNLSLSSGGGWMKKMATQSRAPASIEMPFTPKTVFKNIYLRFDREAQ